MNRSFAFVSVALFLCVGLLATASAAGLLVPGVPRGVGGRTVMPVGHGHAFLQLPGVRGSSTDHVHAGWSEVLGCSLSINTAAAPRSTSTGAGAGRSPLQSLTIAVRPGKASAYVLASVGRPIKGMVLDVPAGANSMTSLTFRNCILTAFSLTLDAAASPVEQFSFAYDRVTIGNRWSSQPAETNWPSVPVR